MFAKKHFCSQTRVHPVDTLNEARGKREYALSLSLATFLFHYKKKEKKPKKNKKTGVISTPPPTKEKKTPSLFPCLSSPLSCRSIVVRCWLVLEEKESKSAGCPSSPGKKKEREKRERGKRKRNNFTFFRNQSLSFSSPRRLSLHTPRAFALDLTSRGPCPDRLSSLSRRSRSASGLRAFCLAPNAQR